MFLEISGSNAPTLRWIGPVDITRALSVAKLCEALTAGFKTPPVVAPRTTLRLGDGPNAPEVLVMSAGSPNRILGIKVAHIAPKRMPDSRCYTYLVLDAKTGKPVALLDGEALTLHRTAAVSALAARHLAVRHPDRALIVGAGPIAGALASAYAATFPETQLYLWARRPDSALRQVAQLRQDGVEIEVAHDLSRAVSRANIVSCATSSRVPLIHGAWLTPGCHLDLVGGFKTDMREVDDGAMARAAVIVVDNEAAVREAGDLVHPLANGVLKPEQIITLGTLLNDESLGRTDTSQITVFKAVGHALADLVAAEVVLCHPDSGDLGH